VRLSWTNAKGDSCYVQAKCIDYSAGGLRVESAESIPLRTVVSLRADHLSIVGSASVKHIERRSGKAILGLAFSQPQNPKVRATLPKAG